VRLLSGAALIVAGHAETLRLWQSREFWEKADLALAAGGELTRLYDAHRAETAAPAGTITEQPDPPPAVTDHGPPA